MIEKVAWSAPLDLTGIEILSAENSQRPWIQYHETYTICNIGVSAAENRNLLSRTAEWIYRGKTHYSGPHSVILIEPGELHRNTKTPPPDPFTVLFIDPKEFNKIAAEAGMSPNPHFREATTTNPRLYRALVQLHAALAKPTTLLHRQSMLTDCIGTLMTEYCEKTPRPAPYPARRHLGWSRDFLKEHFSEKITLAQLAEISGLSRYHFLRAFSQEFGLPPHRYQIALRVQKARQLLKSGHPADEAADEAGFSDQSHLIRHFKSAMGVTPGRYGAMVRSGT